MSVNLAQSLSACLLESFRNTSGKVVRSHIEERKEATSIIFLPEASLPALDGGVDRLHTKAFLPWLELVCSLLMQMPYLSLPALPLSQGGDTSGVDLMTAQTIVQLLTIKTLLASNAT